MTKPLTVTANGFRFTGLEWGDADAPAVLCLHGFPQHSASWTALGHRLAASGLRVVALDQRGYSAGARPTEIADYALPHLVADAVAMIESLDGPVHLVGHDWGGVVGWQVAARRPDLVQTWTAVSTPHPQALAEVLQRDPDQQARLRYMAGFREVGVAESALLANGAAGLAAVYGGTVAPERVAEDVAFVSQPGVLTAALSWYRAMSPTDAVGLPTVAVPTTYIWGSEDIAFGRAAAEATHAHVQPPYRFIALEGASHWLPDEDPDTIADAVIEQVRDC